MYQSLFLFLTFFLTANHFVFSQSAWVKNKGQGYVQLSYNNIPSYNRVFNQKGDEIFTSRDISDQTFHLYAEYGLTDKLTLITIIPFKRLTAKNEVVDSSFPLTIDEGELNTFGNVSIAMRHKIAHKKFALSTQLQIDLPTAKFDVDTGLNSGIDSYSFIPTFSFGNGNSKLFFQGSLGFVLRTNDYSNGFIFNLEGGKKYFNQLWVIPFVNIFDSFADGDVNTPIQNLETMQNLDRAQYGGFGFKLIEEINPKFGVTAAVGGAFFAHLEAKQLSLNLGVYYKFDKK